MYVRNNFHTKDRKDIIVIISDAILMYFFTFSVTFLKNFSISEEILILL